MVWLVCDVVGRGWHPWVPKESCREGVEEGGIWVMAKERPSLVGRKLGCTAAERLPW